MLTSVFPNIPDGTEELFSTGKVVVAFMATVLVLPSDVVPSEVPNCVDLEEEASELSKLLVSIDTDVDSVVTLVGDTLD